MESQSYRLEQRWFEMRQKGSLAANLEIKPPNESKRHAVRVTLNRPQRESIIWRFRFFHAGMPLYEEFLANDVQLHARDPSWDPFGIMPYASPEVHRKRGTYLPGEYYEPDDPVWVWEENRWHPAVVVAVERWVSVRYLDNFRDRKRNCSKSYRTWQIWPVIGELSEVFRADIERFL
ncbi:hypothetical protein [Kutzneria buriramensis]|uniref:hypothetical protein n=1 Tax=Kutzneria buriramensis TaxID=1045776 RepID=UPI0011C1B6FD|nr:hypothetical protein [Kutzneria buriramensis]